MTGHAASERGFGRPLAIFSLSVATLAILLFFYGRDLRGFVRESLMQSVTSAHYEILCPVGALTQGAMTDFATHREPLFARLDKKLGNADSNLEIRIVLDPDLRASPQDDRKNSATFYAVSGTTIRANLHGAYPQLPAAGDAESLLYAAWGKPGNAQIARWTALWLVGNWSGGEIGMAAAQVEQRLGHKKVASVLVDPGNEISSSDDRALLGAAWISEIAEFGGADAVRKLYATKMPHPSVAEAAQALGTTPPELDRKWQLWMYAYLAGMPPMQNGAGMEMDMPMPGR